MAETAPEAPVGPLDPVFTCSGCGCLVVDNEIHERVCPGTATTGSPGASLGPQIIEWLDTLDPEEVERQALEAEWGDANGTVAVLNRLKQLAAAL